jgi:glycosyltransferase involved in cell wall biosynthesis
VRIALITHIRSRIGGTEAYVEQLAGELHRAGHAVALWHEHDGPPGRGVIALPADAASWSVERLGLERAIAELREWRPDVLFSHGVSTPLVEASILRVGPTVMFVHAYHGACVSGTKSRLSPRRMPCARPLGMPCLVHYLPRRCGGWSPVTMARRYRLETRRRDMLSQYAAIVTASSHMRAEYLKYDIPPARVLTVGLMIPQTDPSEARGAAPTDPSAAPAASNGDLAREWRLMFVARLTALKGGALLLDALPYLRAEYDGRIALTIAGDGPERPALESKAAQLKSRVPNVDVRFAGWLDSPSLGSEMRATDLLVVPSIWPEPYGLVGPEAGRHAVPAAAFAVGGIPDWLRDGVNGHLASGRPPTAAGLADAIARSLRDPGLHATLRTGALAQARELSPDRHLPRVLAVLRRAAAGDAFGIAGP